MSCFLFSPFRIRWSFWWWVLFSTQPSSFSSSHAHIASSYAQIQVGSPYFLETFSVLCDGSFSFLCLVVCRGSCDIEGPFGLLWLQWEQLLQCCRWLCHPEAVQVHEHLRCTLCLSCSVHPLRCKICFYSLPFPVSLIWLQLNWRNFLWV